MWASSSRDLFLMHITRAPRHHDIGNAHPFSAICGAAMAYNHK